MKLTLYDLDALARKLTDNKQKAYYSNQEVAIIEGDTGVVLAYFNCSCEKFDSLNSMVYIELLDIDASVYEYIASDRIEISIREIKEAAPSKEIDACDFFHTRDIRCMKRSSWT